MIDAGDGASARPSAAAQASSCAAEADRDVAAALAWLDAHPVPGGPAEVLLVTVQRVAVLNAVYGRRAGDQLLATITARLDRVAADDPGASMVARIGGSEFLVAAAPGAAERVARALAAPLMLDGMAVAAETALAVGSRAPGFPAAALFADLRARAGSADRELLPEGTDALAIDLHRAIGRGEIQVLFQPQVALAPAVARPGTIVGAEALARWEHPRLGTLGAEPLFAAAARAGLAEKLSAHVQELALRRAVEWPAPAATLRLSINVTPADLGRADFADRFLERLTGSGFPPRRLTVEVTENGLIAELDAAAASLARLRAQGCLIALDDFGTGYSSLAWLRELPVDAIKLDKAITRDVTESARDRAVLDGVIGIARRLGLATVAEGVESPAQRDLLAEAGCDLFQGFLCAEALDGASLAALATSQPG